MLFRLRALRTSADGELDVAIDFSVDFVIGQEKLARRAHWSRKPARNVPATLARMRYMLAATGMIAGGSWL